MAAARINQLRLRREATGPGCGFSGLEACDLAQLARLSPATLTAALKGTPVSQRTVRKIALVIARTPVIPEALELLDEER